MTQVLEFDVGRTVDIPVRRSETYIFAAPDTLAVAQTMAGSVELSFLGLRNQWLAQSFKVTGESDIAKDLSADRIQGQPSIDELVTVKLGTGLALDTITTLAQHLVRLNLASAEEIRQRIEKAINIEPDAG